MQYILMSHRCKNHRMEKAWFGWFYQHIKIKEKNTVLLCLFFFWQFPISDVAFRVIPLLCEHSECIWTQFFFSLWFWASTPGTLWWCQAEQAPSKGADAWRSWNLMGGISKVLPHQIGLLVLHTSVHLCSLAWADEQLFVNLALWFYKSIILPTHF